MNFRDTLAYCIYPLYSWLCIHNAPTRILDLFIPILCNERWYNALMGEMEDAESFNTVEEAINWLHEETKK